MSNSEIRLFIATTLDGYIARENHSLDWLYELDNPDGIDYGYGEFLSEIDTVILGRKTYEEILGFGVEWPYASLKSFVVTSDKNYETKTENTFTQNNISKETFEKLKGESSKNIWIVGGGQLIAHILELDLIDEMTITVVPRFIGKGIRLFPESNVDLKLKLIKCEAFDAGVVNLTYRKL